MDYRITKISEDNNFKIDQVGRKCFGFAPMVSWDYADIREKMKSMQVGESYIETI